MSIAKRNSATLFFAICVQEKSKENSTGNYCDVIVCRCVRAGGGLEDIAYSINVPSLSSSECGSNIGPNRLCAGYRGRSIGLCKVGQTLFLANVNSSSGSLYLYVVVRPSVVCLSVCRL